MEGDSGATVSAGRVLVAKVRDGSLLYWKWLGRERYDDTGATSMIPAANQGTALIRPRSFTVSLSILVWLLHAGTWTAAGKACTSFWPFVRHMLFWVANHGSRWIDRRRCFRTRNYGSPHAATGITQILTSSCIVFDA